MKRYGMKRTLSAFSAFIAFIFLIGCFMVCPSHKTTVADAAVYIGGVSLPLKEYPPGSFFTKNGKACTCHYDNSIDCIANGSRCNCLRYVTIDGKKVDLLGTQCFGFARYVQYRVFGYHDASTSKFYSVGSLSKGKVTQDAVKDLIQRSKPGAHIRFKLSSTSHSAVLMSYDSKGFTVYHANAGGDGVESKPCVVSTKYYTYEYFASYAYRGIEYIKLPYDYPATKIPAENTGTTEKPTAATKREGELCPGDYVTTEYLNLRSEPDNEAESMGVIKKGTELYVGEISGNFGKTVKNGKTGWICLEYAELIKRGSFSVIGGLIKADGRNVAVFELSPLFKDGTVKVEKADGSIKGSDERVCTGDTVKAVSGGVELIYALSLRGDLNGDGASDVTDVILMKKYIGGRLELKGAYLASADMSGSGNVTVADYIMLKMFVR